MCSLQLRDPNSAPTEARRIRCPHPVILCTDALQLDLPSEQRPQVPGVLTEERWSEDLGEGACDLRWWDKLERGGRGWLDGLGLGGSQCGRDQLAEAVAIGQNADESPGPRQVDDPRVQVPHVHLLQRLHVHDVPHVPRRCALNLQADRIADLF